MHGFLFVIWLGSVVTFGALAASGNPTLMAGGIGAIALAFLLRDPKISIPIIVLLSLPTGALISMTGPAAAKLPWLVSALTFSLWPLALGRVLQQKKVPAFIPLAVALAAYSLVFALAQGNSLAEVVAGFKRYFQGYGVMFALAAFDVKRRDITALGKIIMMIAALQLPFAIYEFVVLVPLRGGLEAGGEATDVVAGTFGANLVGGSANGEMAAFLLIVFSFLLSRWRIKLLTTARFTLLALVCLAPLVLGETKVVVFLFPIILMILLRKDLMKKPDESIPMFIGGAVLCLAFGYVYVALMDNNAAGDSFANTLQYNVGNNGYGNNILNRTTVLSFWWEHHSLEAPFQMFFGHGIGSAYLGMNNLIPGHVALRYPRYGIDLTSASTLLWDLGAFGFFFHLSLYFVAWSAAGKLWKQVVDPAVRADLLSIQAALAVFLVFTFYRDSSVNLLSFEIVVALVLGYLAWLVHSHPQTNQSLQGV
jgi:hypothetical protein